MQYPTPLACVAGTIVPEDIPAVGESYAAALFADLDRALASLPHDRIAVQWDVAVEFGLLEGSMGPAGAMPVDQVAPGLIRCIDHVPDDVPVGMHLCYGDYGHQHFKQPDSLAMQVALVNALVSGAPRPVNWFSFTVPQGRSDSGYSPRCAISRQARTPSSISRSSPTTQPTSRRRAPPPSRCDRSTRRWPSQPPARATGESAPSAGWAGSTLRTCRRCWTCTLRFWRRTADGLARAAHARELLALLIQGHSFANQVFQRTLVNGVTFSDVDRTPDVPAKAGVEQA